MDKVMLLLGWLGVFAPIVLAAIGSSVACMRAGQAACGAMLEVESGYGRYIGAAAMPASQMIYGIVITLTLNKPLTPDRIPGVFILGFLSGVVLMLISIYQGQACAGAINVSKTKPEVFGISLAPAALIEGFSVFSFVFALVLAGSLPK
ncbi:MAG: ATP synthase subunit C [Planctomycetota bacterium]